MPSTATEWLISHPDDAHALGELLEGVEDLPIGLLTEMPLWMKEEIAVQLAATFKEDYWDDIARTTMGDAERALSQGLENGWSIRRIAKEMRDSLGGDKYAKVRALNIARTESGHALNGARKASLNRLMDDLGPEVPMRPTWLSVLGNTTRDSHASLHGVPADENRMWYLAGYEIPWPGYTSLPPEERCNCFPTGTLVEGNFVGAQKAWYEGIFTEIVLRSGGRFTMTPNHPVISSERLIPAKELNPGDKVLTYNSKVDCTIGMGSGCNEIDYKPVSIEKIFEAFFIGSVMGTGSSVKVKSAKKYDFYGDGEFINGNVDIVRADWKLLCDGNFSGFEKVGNHLFAFVDDAGAIDKFSFGSLGFSGEGFYRSSTTFPSLTKPGLKIIIGRITPSGSLAVGIASDFDVVLSKDSGQNRAGYTCFLRESLKRYSGLVALDEVVDVRNFYSAGHVYDLQSKYGTVINYGLLNTGIGLVTSNCQCTIVMEFGMQDSEAVGLIQNYYDRDESNLG